MLDQILVSSLQTSSIALAYWPHHDMRRFASLIGLAAQPFWIWVLVSHELWAVLPIAPIYSVLYGWASWQHWSRWHREQQKLASKEESTLGINTPRQSASIL